jgi:hypothetical protein
MHNINVTTLIVLHAVAIQAYDSYVNQAHVIRGNDVIVKCDIPSFVTDFVQVVSWQDNQDSVFQMNPVASHGREGGVQGPLQLKCGLSMRKNRLPSLGTKQVPNAYFCIELHIQIKEMRERKTERERDTERKKEKESD